MRVSVFSIDERVADDEAEGEHGKLKLIMNPIILRLMLEEANDLLLKGGEGPLWRLLHIALGTLSWHVELVFFVELCDIVIKTFN